MKDLSCDMESDQAVLLADLAREGLGNSPHQTHFPALHQFLEQALSRGQVMGAVVLVAHKGELVLSLAGGLADKEKDQPMQEDTVFRLGSVSKSISSWMALRLAEEGVWSLKDRVTRYLPNFGPSYQSSCPPISIHHLLTHTSGLSYRFTDGENGRYAQAQVSDGIDQPNLSWQENFRRMCTVPLRFAPGTGWRYSLGVDVMGQALQVAAGKDLSTLLEETICSPLGLRHCSFYGRDYFQVAANYQSNGGRLSRVERSLDLGIGTLCFDEAFMSLRSMPVYAGVSMLGSGPDLMRILLALRSGRLLSEEHYHAVLTDLAPHSPKCIWTNWGYTYGAAVSRQVPDRTMPMSTGSLQWVGAFGQKWMFDPYKDVIIVSMTNTAPEGLFGAFPDQVRDAVYTDLGLMPD